jgi:hypothetical protein
MGALEDDLDYGLRQQGKRYYQSHTLLDATAGWDEVVCSRCKLRGGVALSWNLCNDPLTVTDPR